MQEILRGKGIFIPCGFLQSSKQQLQTSSCELMNKHLQISAQNQITGVGSISSKFSLRYDSQLQQIDGTLSTIEMQREALEGANTNTAVLTTMNDAAKALKKANNELDVDKVARVGLVGRVADGII